MNEPWIIWTKDMKDNNSSPKDVHVLIPGTCEYVLLHGKRKLKTQVELRWWIT